VAEVEHVELIKIIQVVEAELVDLELHFQVEQKLQLKVEHLIQ